MVEWFVIMHESLVECSTGDPVYRQRVDEVSKEISRIKNSGSHWIEMDCMRGETLKGI